MASMATLFRPLMRRVSPGFEALLLAIDGDAGGTVVRASMWGNVLGLAAARNAHSVTSIYITYMVVTRSLARRVRASSAWRARRRSLRSSRLRSTAPMVVILSSVRLASVNLIFQASLSAAHLSGQWLASVIRYSRSRVSIQGQ